MFCSFLTVGEYGQETYFKGGYLDFSHLTELRKLYITKIYMKNNTNHQYLRIIKLQKKIHIYIFDGVPLKGYIASLVIFRFCVRNK